MYTVKASGEIGLFYLEFWRLGTVLHELLRGTLPAPSAERLPPARRLVGPHGSFKTSDDLLLFCLYYLVAGYSQQDLGEKYHARKNIKNRQAPISRWWTRAAPFFRATLEHCCASPEYTLQMLAYRLRKLALAHKAQRSQPKRVGQAPSVDLIALVGAKCPLFSQPAAKGPR